MERFLVQLGVVLVWLRLFNWLIGLKVANYNIIICVFVNKSINDWNKKQMLVKYIHMWNNNMEFDNDY